MRETAAAASPAQIYQICPRELTSATTLMAVHNGYLRPVKSDTGHVVLVRCADLAGRVPGTAVAYSRRLS
jgi:hypothetical protein